MQTLEQYGWKENNGIYSKKDALPSISILDDGRITIQDNEGNIECISFEELQAIYNKAKQPKEGRGIKRSIEEYGWRQDEKDKNKYSKPTNVIVGGYISEIIFGKNGITLSIQHRDISPEEILAIYNTAKQIEGK